jgi:hypothetical protein
MSPSIEPEARTKWRMHSCFLPVPIPPVSRGRTERGWRHGASALALKSTLSCKVLSIDDRAKDITTENIL